jgi:thiol:disulfide interchange protein
MRNIGSLTLLVAFLFAAMPVHAQEKVRVSTAWPVDGARPGELVALAIVVDIDEGFHVNPDPAQVVVVGDFEPYPTDVRILEAASGLTLEAVRFPKPHPIQADYADGDLMVFEGRTVFFLPIKVGEEVKPGSQCLKLEVEYQACDAYTCFIPRTVVLEAPLEIVDANQPVNRVNSGLFEGYGTAGAVSGGSGVRFDLFGWTFSIDTSSATGLILLLIVAALGGGLLNLTPCVLPVIPIKIIGLAQASESQARRLVLGTSMSLGVVAFWLALGTMIAGVSGFTATNQLFQYPLFTILVGLTIAVMAIGMCGLFYIRLPQTVYRFNPGQDSLTGSFGFGMMTAVLSTPCTAPFMGAAAAWAATQYPATTLLTFASIGAGMAAPYLALSIFPALVNRMPRTGPASELIKQVMGLLMLAAAAYFVGVGLSALVVTPPDPPGTGYWWAVMAFGAAAGSWLVYGMLRITARAGRRAVFGCLGAALVVFSAVGAVRFTDKGPIDWIYYTPARLEEALEEGRVVVMDFTAEWCLNCKVLEHNVLQSPEVVKLLARPDVAAVKVDITGNNPVGKEKLRKTGRLTIPLLVIYAPDGREVFKSDFYTVDQVVTAVNRARGMLGFGLPETR